MKVSFVCLHRYDAEECQFASYEEKNNLSPLCYSAVLGHPDLHAYNFNY
jgi:hypothetical protein